MGSWDSQLLSPCWHSLCKPAAHSSPYSIAPHHHYIICTLVQHEMLCSQSSRPSLTSSCTAKPFRAWVTEILQSGNFWLVHSMLGFCTLLFSSSLFTGYIVSNCELLVSRYFSATWLFVVWLSPSIILYICVCIPIYIPLQLLRLIESSASLRDWPAASGQNKPVSAHICPHTGTHLFIKPFWWPQKISTYGNYGTINLELQTENYKSPF